jgi:hypothetical protein
MNYIIGIPLLILGIITLVIGIQVLFTNKDVYQHNHNLTGNLSNALVGNIDKSKVRNPDEVTNGMVIDTRNGELVMTTQLSKEAINS